MLRVADNVLVRRFLRILELHTVLRVAGHLRLRRAVVAVDAFVEFRLRFHRSVRLHFVFQFPILEPLVQVVDRSHDVALLEHRLATRPDNHPRVGEVVEEFGNGIHDPLIRLIAVILVPFFPCVWRIAEIALQIAEPEAHEDRRSSDREAFALQ